MLTEIVATNKSLKDEDDTVKAWTLDSSMISGSVLQEDLFFIIGYSLISTMNI